MSCVLPPLVVHERHPVSLHQLIKLSGPTLQSSNICISIYPTIPVPIIIASAFFCARQYCAGCDGDAVRGVDGGVGQERGRPRGSAGRRVGRRGRGPIWASPGIRAGAVTSCAPGKQTCVQVLHERSQEANKSQSRSHPQISGARRATQARPRARRAGGGPPKRLPSRRAAFASPWLRTCARERRSSSRPASPAACARTHLGGRVVQRRGSTGLRRRAWRRHRTDPRQ